MRAIEFNLLRKIRRKLSVLRKMDLLLVANGPSLAINGRLKNSPSKPAKLYFMKVIRPHEINE